MKRVYIGTSIILLILILVTIFQKEDKIDKKVLVINSTKNVLINNTEDVSIKKDNKNDKVKELIEEDIKKSPKSIKSMTLDEVLKDTNNGKKVEPKILVKVLNDYFSNFDNDVNIAVTLKLTPIFHLLNNNYAYYKSVILEMFRGKENHELLRLPMLEIIANHFEDEESLKNVKEVFLDESGESSLMLGKSAKALAKNKIDISEKLLDRYSGAEDVAKNFYAKSFAYLKTKEAMDMIESDIDDIEDISIKSSLIQSFTDIEPNSEQVIAKLRDMIDNSIPKSNFNNSEKEIFMVQSIVALSKSNNNEIYEKHLIDIASNNKMSLSARATALDSYYGLPTNIDKSKVEKSLLTLLDNLESSKSSTNDEKEYLGTKIEEILNTLKKEK